MSIEIGLKPRQLHPGAAKKRSGGSSSGSKAQGRFRGPKLVPNPPGSSRVNPYSIFNREIHDEIAA